MKTLFIIFLMSLACISKAQQVGARITETSVGLYNESSKAVKFLLGVEQSALDTFQINGESVWHSPQYNRNPIIKIATNNKLLSYKLRLGRYYKIFWNDKRRYWDINRIKQESEIPK